MRRSGQQLEVVNEIQIFQIKNSVFSYDELTAYLLMHCFSGKASYARKSGN